jgi:type VI secretion system protein ImpH
MPRKKRQPPADLIRQLLEQPWRFGFTQAVTLLQLCLARNGGMADDDAAEHLRFQNSLSLRFPPSQIEALQVHTDATITDTAQLIAALRDGTASLQLTPAFIGYLGVCGALPAHYTESVANHQQQAHDHSARAFLDLYSSRAVAMFYRACIKYRLERDRGGRLRGMLVQLAGQSCPMTPMPARQVHEETVAYYSGAIQRRAVSGGMLATVLSEYFAVPVVVQQFISSWVTVPPAQQTVLGISHCIIDEDFMLGDGYFSHDRRVRLRIGPLCQADFDLFVPEAQGALALQQMLRLFACAPLQVDVQLVLRAADVRPFNLDDADGSGTGIRLGIDIYLLDGPETVDRDDFQYTLAL